MDLDRFKEDTGYDFVELMHDRSLRAEILSNSNVDVDRDEVRIQQEYGNIQRSAWVIDD